MRGRIAKRTCRIPTLHAVERNLAQKETTKGNGKSDTERWAAYF